LGSFKAGPFIFAIKSGAVLVPMVLRGASQILQKNHFLPNLKAWRSEILIEVLEPISTQNYTLENRHQLQDFVFQRMQEALDKSLP
jgi:1-acyl-sn-glycerol-3-phosphate acyltransferase